MEGADILRTINTLVQYVQILGVHEELPIEHPKIQFEYDESSHV